MARSCGGPPKKAWLIICSDRPLCRWVVSIPRHIPIGSRHNPALEPLVVPARLVVRHWVGINAALDHLVEAMENALPRLVLVEADEHVGHEACRRDACGLQHVDTAKEHLLVF